MRYKIIDKQYRFLSVFDDETGAYIRTGILDGHGRDTGVDPFRARSSCGYWTRRTILSIL